MKVKVKICGIRTLDQAEAAIAAGADFLGFNFVSSSRRVIDPATAKNIIEKVRGKAAAVGVFQDHSIEEVNAICDELGLDFAQLHGSEDIAFCKEITIPVIKVFGVTSQFDVREVATHMEQYNIPYYLIDREKQGEGESLSLEHAAELAQSYPLFFSGALHHDNIADVVSNVKPFAVDVAGGVETDGYPDLEKITKFIQNAKEISF